MFPQKIVKKNMKSQEDELKSVSKSVNLNLKKSKKSRRIIDESVSIGGEAAGSIRDVVGDESVDISLVNDEFEPSAKDYSNIDNNVDTPKQPVKLSSSSNIKPGIAYQRLDNFNLDPYVIGIAVKPY